MLSKIEETKAYKQGYKAAKYAVSYGAKSSPVLVTIMQKANPYKGPYDPSAEYSNFETGFSDYITERFCGTVVRPSMFNRCRTLSEAEQLCKLVNAGVADDVSYVVSDDGESVSPRYDIVVFPRLGQPVTKGFNGDYYPAGRISSISSTGRRITTDTGVVFYRRKETRQRWRSGQTWTMVDGWFYRQNPSF